MYIDDFSGKYDFLSTYYPSAIPYQGEVYPTVVAAFQAAKTFIVEDRQKIARYKNPEQAYKAGRKLRLRADWKEVRVSIMRQLCSTKFRLDVDLKKKLLETGTIYLEESNTRGDMFWGVVNGDGENHLGKILMEVRKQLKEEDDEINRFKRKLPKEIQELQHLEKLESVSGPLRFGI